VRKRRNVPPYRTWQQIFLLFQLIRRDLQGLSNLPEPTHLREEELGKPDLPETAPDVPPRVAIGLLGQTLQRQRHHGHGRTGAGAVRGPAEKRSQPPAAPQEPMTRQHAGAVPNFAVNGKARAISVALLTGGGDRHYAFGLAMALVSTQVALDLIGSDLLDCPEFHDNPGINFLNLRGSQRPDVSFLKKVLRVSRYYVKLIRYAATAKPRIFHILWNNKFESLDRTLLMLYYRFLGKRIVLTVHNVNTGGRDSQDTPLNRLTLRIQYRLTDHLFVHTEKMKLELIEEFGVQGSRITVIPFGINNAVPKTRLTRADAKQRLGIHDSEKTILFFGRITPYKGLEYLVAAFREVLTHSKDYRLIIAGRPDNCERYWRAIRKAIQKDVHRGRVLLRSAFIPDDETEVYLKAADVLVLPYTYIFQSGVLFLGYSFGLPMIATDVGSLRDGIVEGRTGFLCRPRDPVDLARAIETYFASDLFKNLDTRRQEIRDYANARHSWDIVGGVTWKVYANLLEQNRS
jgi:glycosyltransferase involved in cell wall biosynthesis